MKASAIRRERVSVRGDTTYHSAIPVKPTTAEARSAWWLNSKENSNSEARNRRRKRQSVQPSDRTAKGARVTVTPASCTGQLGQSSPNHWYNRPITDWLCCRVSTLSTRPHERHWSSSAAG